MPQMRKIWDRDKESEKILEKVTFMDDVTGGTDHIRKVAQERDYIIKFPAETSEEYKSRVDNAVLRPYTHGAVEKAIGKIFAKPISITDLPKEFDTYNILNDFDRNGSDIDEFAEDIAEYQIKHGIVFIYTAFPGIKDGVVASLSRTIRPYARIVRADQIISKKYTMTSSGKIVLWQVVVAETVNKDEDDYAQKAAKRYRKIWINQAMNVIQYQVIERGPKDEEIQVEAGVIKLAGQARSMGDESITAEIPLTPCYGIKKGFFNGVSPFEELGHINIQHLRKSSDYDASEHLSATNTPVMSGDLKAVNPTKYNATQQQKQVGGGEVLMFEQGGKFEWVSGGANLTPFRENIQSLEDYMMSMSFDVMDGGNKTATQINDERNDKESKLKKIAKNIDRALNQTILYMCQYMNIEMTGYVQTNKDFNLTVMPIEDFKSMGDEVVRGNITKETFIKEAQRGERLLTIEDIDEEIEMLNDGENNI